MKIKVYSILLISFILLIVNLGSWGLTETSEARYAEIGKEMLERGDYLHPKLMGISHYHKPPFTYQITALGYKIFGINEFGARFFLQLALIFQLLLVFKLGELLFKDRNLALSAMLIYFSLPIVLIASRNLTTDLYLTTTVLGALYFWLKYNLGGLKKIHLYLFFIMLGIGCEIKGPIGLIFVLVFMVSYYVITKRKPRLNFHHFLGFVLFMLLAVGWYLLVLRERPILWEYFFEGQLVDRIVSKSFHRSKPFWFYFFTIPLVGLPWVIFLVHQSANKFRKMKSNKSIELVLLTSLIVIFMIFSLFKTKLILYILPAFGFVALLTARLLSQAKELVLKTYNKIIFVIASIFSTSIIVLSFLELNFQFNGLLALAIGFTSFISFLILLKGSYKKPYLKTIWLGYTFGCLVLIMGTDFMIQNQASLNSTKPVMNFISQELPEVNTILVYNYLLPSAEFYSKKKIVTLNNGHNTVQRETQFESNDNWKYFNLDLRTGNGREKTISTLQKSTVLITKKKYNIDSKALFLLENFKHYKDFGVWRIYY